MTSASIADLFATRLYRARLLDAALLQDLSDSIWMLEEGDEAGAAWCEEHGYDGYTSYASLDDLPSRAPGFASLAEQLSQHATAFAADLHWDLGGTPLTLDALWVNILGEGGSHSGHIHPGSVLSGTVYIDLPEGAGSLKLEDPRLALMMAAPPLRDDAPEKGRRFVYIQPEPGEIVMWESWLRHEVMPNRSAEPRLSISFNFGHRPQD